MAEVGGLRWLRIPSASLQEPGRRMPAEVCGPATRLEEFDDWPRLPGGIGELADGDGSSRQNIFLPSLPTAIAAFGSRSADVGLCADIMSSGCSGSALREGYSTRPSSFTVGRVPRSQRVTTAVSVAWSSCSSTAIRSSMSPPALCNTARASIATADTLSLESCADWHITCKICSWSYGTPPFSKTSRAIIVTLRSSNRRCALRCASELVRDCSSFSAYCGDRIRTTAVKILWKIFVAVCRMTILLSPSFSTSPGTTAPTTAIMLEDQ
mmetsp:Transcript_21286/g.54291  ORF Transcript_21286/g.54291 Transcript_21286/m.54291 type:complete len:268 (+) Transcript_21286:1697-2500(+)